MPFLELSLAMFAAVAPAIPKATDPPLPAWLDVVAAGDGGDAGNAWDRLWRAKTGASAMAFLPIFEEMAVGEGDDAGRWRFFAYAGAGEFLADADASAGKPNAAWRLVMPETAPYVVHVNLYCDEDSGGCAPLRRELAAMRAPVPTNESLWPEWIAIVENETCAPGPVQMPPPRYPPQALYAQAGGNVVVELLFNRCGDVRHAWLHESSGNRTLDRAAVEGTRKWRVPAPADGARIGRALVPIGFSPDPPPAPAPDAR